MEAVVLVVLAGGLALVVTVLAPLGCAAGGYFTGWILATIFPFAGQWVVDGCGHLGLEITLAMLPPMGAALGYAGRFFKATQTNKNESK